MSTKSPDKRKDLLADIKNCLDSGRYLDTYHSAVRQGERLITRTEMVHVLRNGRHEKEKDRFDPRYSEWNYSICGRTIDARELRIIVSFEANNLLIITAVDLSLKHGN